MAQLEQINEKTSNMKARLDEHDMKINTVVRNQEYIKTT